MREMAFMSQGQAKWFREAAKANQNFARYATTLGSGCRQGELLARAWADLDLAKRTLEVRRALSQVKGKFTLKEPKSRTSRRTVTLPPVRRLGDSRPARGSAEGRANHRPRVPRSHARLPRQEERASGIPNDRREGEPVEKESLRRKPRRNQI